MLNEIDIVGDVSRRFDAAGIAYMLTGSMALNYYAVPRMTRDVDLVVELDASSAMAITQSFEPEYLVEMAAVTEAIAHESMFNLIHLESVIKVDCIVRKASAFRRQEFARRQRISLPGFDTWIVSKEDLILSKLHWARDSHSERQFDDVRNLLASGVNREYLESGLRMLDLGNIAKEIGI